MKKGIVLMLTTIVLSTAAFAQTKYGKEFPADKAMDIASFTKSMQDKTSIDNVIVKGEITQVCQAAGCWLKLKNGTGEDIFVKFKEENGEHELVVPKDIAGKTVTVYGKGSKKSVSVKEQKHFAEDAGASKADIAKISTPKQSLRIDAVGAVVE